MRASVAGSGTALLDPPCTVIVESPVPFGVVTNSTYANIPLPDGPGGGSCQAPLTPSSCPV